MATTRLVLALGLVFLVAGATPARTSGPVTDTLLLHQPAISATHVAFIHDDDLWVADVDGSHPRRLTADEGVESSPAFSPDGRLIAFSAQYDGNTDAYVIPVEGGPPVRLTWHPMPDVVQGFTPDGASVVFTSGRASFTGRFTQLYTVPVEGGVERQLPLPNVDRAEFSSDGKHIAYNPLAPAWRQWKRYRGGTVSTVVVYDVATHATRTIAQPEGRSNDYRPMWIGGRVYFLSDRAGEFNLFSWDPATQAIEQHTRHADFPIADASAGGGKIVYEQAGAIHVFDPSAGTSTRLRIAAVSDLPETRPRFAKGAKWIRSASLSPSGARVAFEFRGEIVTVPAEKGDPRNVTGTPAVHERSPVWSPDGQRIAYVSDAGGEYALHVRRQDGRGEAQVFKLPGAGFYDRLAWAPDGRKIAYTDNSWTLFWIDLESGVSTKIASEPIYGPIKTLRHAWSPDSRWLAYTLNARTAIQAVHVYSLDEKKSYPVTEGMSDVSEPVFDPSGKYLYFFASTDAGPVKDWFSMSNADMRATRALYVTVLRTDLPSPVARESDEEKGPSEEKEDPKDDPNDETSAVGRQDRDQKRDEGRGRTPGPSAAERDAAAKPKPVPFRIDVKDLRYRILDLPVPAGDYRLLSVRKEGQLYYLRTADERTSIQRFDLATRKTETIVPDASDYAVSRDAKKLLYRKDNDWFIVATDKKVEPGAGKLAIDAVQVRVEPRLEWRQIFDEAWRINRDYFYDPNMHGVDWKAMRAKYEVFLPHVANRNDLNRVIRWMCSELAVGHHRVAGGDRRAEPDSVPGGLLGADYVVENGRYRFAKVYGGLNWTPELRAPLTEPGVNVRAGEYVLAVDGRDVRPPENVHRFFENTAGRIVDITVGPNPDGRGSRTVQVVPIASEAALRNRDWVEGNLRKVEEATQGRVAYVYVPNTTSLGHTYFKRYFYPQANREAIIVDERFNGGGQVADYYIDLLRRPLVSYWATRYGEDLRTPAAAVLGPKVMIIDETAGSGGDLLPWMFRKFELGPLVGKRTWGGLVGILGFPVLLDGGTITAPNLAFWTGEGWAVENEGVPPDIEVEQTPADVIAGRDPQLERAIAVVMEALNKQPQPRPSRPPYPRR